ncbi:hypothetical protein BSK64_28390 [Paenibacillus odorifer]|uniref:hypothetical protein n=1 Tax=Paenibacillus odorifer TaxID=189426 RepID=UPI00096FF121|nr:hypothetical protein [Paenibacillus odorifer]OMD97605.1 hypothetical protein BSK64_28390 [Paenibacillus odorifer]
MKKSTHLSGATVLKNIAKGAIILFCVPILSVWAAGSVVCAIIAPIGGVLGIIGIQGIGLNAFPDYDLPNILSLPIGLCLSLLLFISFYYTRRLLRGCLHFIKN